MDHELERARRLLEQSEDGRESLVQQVCLCLCTVPDYICRFTINLRRQNHNQCSIFSEKCCFLPAVSQMSSSVSILHG